MIYKASGIFEGGAMAGVYTAGVLDVLIDNDIYFSNVIGVSAGSANAVNYVAKQRNRTIDCMAVKDKKLKFFGFGTLLRRHTFYDFDLCFKEFADKYIPFDYKTFYASSIETEVVVTDVDTGRPAYIKCAKEGDQMVLAARASSSMPFFSRIYKCDGINCLDGGVSDSIPMEHAKEYGNEKMVIISTKPYGYRKEPPGTLIRFLTRLVYRKYPDFIKAMNERYIMFNRQIKELEKAENEGSVFVFRPERSFVGRMESKNEKLMLGYNAGIKDATDRFGMATLFLTVL